jgi:hypothetical protein
VAGLSCAATPLHSQGKAQAMTQIMVRDMWMAFAQLVLA